MHIVIIEDERNAGIQLQRMVSELLPGNSTCKLLDSVSDSVEYLSNPFAEIDLIFLDIQLSDGSAFDIFKKISLEVPVIFTTAYEQYALQAFEVWSIDYLLKPLRKEKLAAALQKFIRMDEKMGSQQTFTHSNAHPKQVSYRKSFLLSRRDQLVPVRIEEFAWFDLRDTVIKGMEFSRRYWLMEERSLEELAVSLPPGMFFRANRQYLVNRASIVQVHQHFGGRLSLLLNPATPERILVSKDRKAAFRDWIIIG